MIAFDTNVMVRFLVNDDRRQSEQARKLIEEQDTVVPMSVLLETEWVLRSAYRLERREVFEKLRAFLNLPRVKAQDLTASISALDWAEQGMDFADALHLATSVDCDAFASFDRAFARTAARIGAPVVRAP